MSGLREGWEWHPFWVTEALEVTGKDTADSPALVDTPKN